MPLTRKQYLDAMESARRFLLRYVIDSAEAHEAEKDLAGYSVLASMVGAMAFAHYVEKREGKGVTTKQLEIMDRAAREIAEHTYRGIQMSVAMDKVKNLTFSGDKE